jgi:hypothetical protein
LEISEAAMSGNPSFSQLGAVDAAMNGGYFMAASGNGADVPLFHPAMAPPHDHGGSFGYGDAAAAAMDVGAHFAAANNLVLASLATQLFGAAPAAAAHGHGDYLGATTPPEEEMGGGYDVAVGDSSGGAVSLACLGHGQPGDMAAGWCSTSARKPSCNWSSSNAGVHGGSYYLAGVPEAAGFVSAAAAASELSLSLCSKSSSDSMLNAGGDQCSSAASRSGLTQMSRVVVVEPEPPLVPYYPAANFAVVVARSRYAAVAQQVLNDAVGCVLGGVADAAADSASGVDSGSSRPSSCSVAGGAPSSAVSSNNQLIASSGEHTHGGGDASAQWLRSELLTMLQLVSSPFSTRLPRHQFKQISYYHFESNLKPSFDDDTNSNAQMDQKYNQCLDEIQSTTARFNTLTHATARAAGMSSSSICAPFAHRAVSAMYHGLRRRIAGEIMSAAAAAGRPCRGGESSSAVTGGERERSWESAFIQKHWAVQQLRRGEQQCWRPQRGLPEKSVAVLKAWMFENFLRP